MFAFPSGETVTSKNTIKMYQFIHKKDIMIRKTNNFDEYF